MKIFFSTISHFVVAVLFLASISASTAAAQATLTTDKTDYAPGETAYLLGTGFTPGETVTLQVLHADGTPDTGEDHEPWDVVADHTGTVDTTWHVCEDDCLHSYLLATADGATSGLHAEAEFTDAMGTGVVTVTSVGGSCVTGSPPPPQGNAPFNWEVVQGGTYLMTISGVSECSGTAITVFVQGSLTGNFCFNLTATGMTGVYSGQFTMPNPACFTYPLSYKCGANAPCNNANTFGALGPGGASSVHLRAAIFDAQCHLLGTDEDCTAGCTPTSVPVIVNCTNGNMDLGCNPASVPICDTTVTAHDECGPVNVNCSIKDVMDGCVTTRTITYTASNAAGTSTCVKTLTWTTDTTDPELVGVPAGGDLGCNPTTPSCDEGVTATDNCDSSPDVVCHAGDITGDDCNLSQTFSYTATDNCGNSVTEDVVYTWKVDLTDPTLANVPEGGDLGCNPTPPSCDEGVTAVDNCDGILGVTCTPGEPTGDDCNRSQTFTYSAVDSCGNDVSQSVTYTWRDDTTVPDITCAADVEENGSGECCIDVVLEDPIVSDNCTGEVIVTNDHPSTEFCLGDTVVTWTATDGCGNSATCEQTVTVLGQICATKFYDANANGVQDNGEVGIAGWLITVEPGYSGYTDGTGSICFDVPAGSYTVSEGTPVEPNWVHTTPTSCVVSINGTTCSKSASFGNYCFSAPANGLTLGYWSNKNGQKVLSQNWPQWKDCLNALNLKDAAGNDFQMNQPSTGTGTGVNATNAYTQFRNWILSATATNMAYMLSAQLAATTLSDKYNGLDANQGIIVPGGIKTGSNVCMVPFLSVTQAITCGAPPLLALTAMPGSTACGCSSNDGLATIAAVMARADCLLGAYPLTKTASTQRTYQECVKNILDMVNNNGNNGYACGGLSQYINSGSSDCPATF